MRPTRPPPPARMFHATIRMLVPARSGPSGRCGLRATQPVEGDGPGGRHVEGIHLGRHGDANLEVGRGKSARAQPATLRAEKQGHSGGTWTPGAERADVHGLCPWRQGEERVAAVAEPSETTRPIVKAGEGQHHRGSRRHPDGLAVQGIGGAGREERGAGAEGQRVSEDRADIARIAEAFEQDHRRAARLGEDGLRCLLGAALADGEAPVVELDADDGVDDVLTDQVGRHPRVGEGPPEGVEGGRRDEGGAGAIAADIEKPAHDLAPLRDESAAAAAPLGVTDLAVVGQARVVRVLDRLDVRHGTSGGYQGWYIRADSRITKNGRAAWSDSTISWWSEQVSPRRLPRGAVRRGGRWPWWTHAPSGARARSGAACRRRFSSARRRPSTADATWRARGCRRDR